MRSNACWFRRRRRGPAAAGTTFVALWSLLISASLAAGQDAPPPTACRVLADVLARARESGAVRRVEGLHPFTLVRRFQNDDGTPRGTAAFLMTYDVAVVDTAITVGVRVWDPGHPGPSVEISYVVSTRDGRLVRLTSDAGNQGTTARIEDGTLVIEKAGEEPVRQPWRDEIVPKVVLAFIGPMLHDQGLPTALDYRDLNPFGQVPKQEARLRLLRDDERPGALLAFGSFEGRSKPTTVVEVDEQQRVVSIVTESSLSPDGKHVTHLAESRRLSPEAFEKLRTSGESLDIR